MKKLHSATAGSAKQQSRKKYNLKKSIFSVFLRFAQAFYCMESYESTCIMKRQ